MLNVNETQLNNVSRITIERIIGINEASGNNSCSSTRVHLISKDFECDQWQKSFTRSSSLTRHKMIHRREKSFECDICQNKFTQSSHLTTLKRTHTGEKPYEYMHDIRIYVAH